MSSKSHLYQAGDIPVFSYKESCFLDHLSNIQESEEPVRLVHLTSFVYPSFLICQELERGGLLESHVIPRAKGIGGKSPKSYSLSKQGSVLLEQHFDFMIGNQEANVHLWRELINYWREFFPSRYMQYYASLLMLDSLPESQKEAIAVLGTMDWFDAPKKLKPLDLAHPVARAMVDAFAYGGAPAAIGLDSANPHSVDEQSGGRMSARLSGWDAHNLQHLQTYLCTESETYIMQYLLTLGTAIALANRPE